MNPLNTLQLDELLLDYIYEKNCIPFIGPDAYKSWLKEDIATKWIDEYAYPLEKSHPLAKIAQYMSIVNPDRNFPEKALSKYLRLQKIPDFSTKENQYSPYSVLAELDLPIYITTNYDHCMEEALRSRGKEPVSDFCRWNENLAKYTEEAGIKNAFDPSLNYTPTPARPLVYHLNGDMDVPRSMVLTEVDYFDFLINMHKMTESKALPSVIRTGLTMSRLLFIGYDLEDITFRVIFHGVLNFFNTRYNEELHISLQLKREVNKKKNIQVYNDYLKKYAINLYHIQLIDSEFNDFVQSLRISWDEYKKRKSSSS